MSSGVNKAIIIGNLGSDPELRYLPDGTPVCEMSVATSEHRKDKETGESKQKTEWHRIVFFNRRAEVCAEYLKKGSKIYAEGSLETQKWKDKNGIDRHKTLIKGRDMHMLGKVVTPSEENNLPLPAEPKAEDANFDDDIPF